ncbi:hypothetical protein FJ945_26070 [Mesorhizobium sp. B2-4-9]|uniref:hypothetical protein n=1 Tax=Mesorhizobium sp. B2-4-9 TaxID=2589940 RepID=UPI0011275C57|nr:hypothetical protein [Mesorhizobium sp. B2-4-9]TPL16956.1 hypothetical protein FJ945_26070 [Mesorhizobium sp. B2-4-9]
MTAQLIHVDTGNLYVLLIDSKIAQIQKCTVSHINPLAKKVDQLDATFGPTHVVEREPYFGSKSELALSAADVTTFAAWLHTQMPRAPTKAFGDAIVKMFPGSMQFRDVLIAAGQIVCAPALKQAPQGEQLHFIEKAKASDPDGFAMLAAACAAPTAPELDQ